MGGEFARQYDAMRAQYLDQVKAQLPALVQTADHQGGRPDLVTLRGMVHKLRGSAGFYGYRQISETAAVLEDWLVSVRFGEASYAEDRLTGLLAPLLDAIRNAEPPALAAETPPQGADAGGAPPV